MPPPPYYECPVCNKSYQRGQLGKHINAHEQKDLIKCVINKEGSCSKSWHPEFNCSGHRYILCPATGLGFEKGMNLHSKHVCTVSYKDWLLGTQVEVQVKSKPAEKRNVVVEEPQEPINEINMILPEDEVHEEKPIPYNHHNEITQLRNENTRMKAELEQFRAELGKFRAWRDYVLSSAPEQNTLLQEKQSQEKQPQEKQSQEKQSQEKQSQEKQSQEKQSQENQPIKVAPKTVIKRLSKHAIHASQKEIAKGMWCTTCNSCNTVAQYATDLRACCNCKKLTHFNDDLTNCYHWDCVVCDKKSCYACVKQAGGNKIKPLCSLECAATYKSQLAKGSA